MDTRPILVIVLLETHSFYDYHCQIVQELRPILQSTMAGKLRYLTIILPDSMDDLPTHLYPLDLGRFVLWFPSFILIEGDSWNQASQSRRKISLQGEVFRGTFVKRILRYHEDIPFNVYSLHQWVQTHTQTHPDWFTLTLQPKNYHEEVLQTYHVLTLSPFWVRSETQAFLPEPKRYLRNSYSHHLIEWRDHLSDTMGSWEDYWRDLHILGLDNYFSFYRDKAEFQRILVRYLDLLIQRYQV